MTVDVTGPFALEPNGIAGDRLASVSLAWIFWLSSGAA
jgi:hypothetical protein